MSIFTTPHVEASRFFRISIVFFFFSVAACAQITYVSHNNYSGDWYATSTWTFLPASETWASPIPGNPTNSNANAITINGYVRAETGITINNANPVVTINDTLLINGNVVLGSGASLNVAAAGILIVSGHLTLEGSFTMANGGNIVVKGNLNVTNGSLQNNANVYVYGSTTTTGGGLVNGCDGFGNPGGCAPVTAGDIENENDLATENPDLYAFVNNASTPVTLLYFSVDQESETSPRLVWSTASEYNFDQFILERSSDGKNFVEIGRVKGNGTTNTQHYYDFVDSTPLFGRNYYLLSALDYDGTIEKFPMVMAISTGKQEVSLYPNPIVASDEINIETNFTVDESDQLIITGASSKVVRYVSVNSGKQKNKIRLDLAPGIYNVQYKGKNFYGDTMLLVK